MAEMREKQTRRGRREAPRFCPRPRRRGSPRGAGVCGPCDGVCLRLVFAGPEFSTAQALPTCPHSEHLCAFRRKSSIRPRTVPSVPSVTRRGLRLGGPRHHPPAALWLLISRFPIVFFPIINNTVMEIPGVKSFYTFIAIIFSGNFLKMELLGHRGSRESLGCSRAFLLNGFCHFHFPSM